MTAVRFARRAFRDVDRIDARWRAHRALAPMLFTSELAQAVRLVRVSPELGPVYKATGATPLRRLLLQRAQFHIYYRYHPAKALVIILDIIIFQRFSVALDDTHLASFVCKAFGV